MKNKFIAVTLLAALMLTGCGSSASSTVESTASSSPNTAKSEAATPTAGTLSVSESAIDDTEFILNTDKAPLVDADPVSGDYGDYITLADYKGLDIEVSADTPIASGMMVNIDYRGTIDGSSFDGSDASDCELVASADSLFPGSGFEEQLFGHKKGDTFTITIDFDSSYWDSALAGNTVVYEVRINSIYKQSPDIALQSVIDQSSVKQYPKSLYESWKAADSSMGSLTAGTTAAAEDGENTYGMEESTVEDIIYTDMKKDLVCRAIMDEEGITESSSEYQDAERAMLSKFGFASTDDMLDVGYSNAEILSLIENDVVLSVLVKYDSEA